MRFPAARPASFSPPQVSDRSRSRPSPIRTIRSCNRMLTTARSMRRPRARRAGPICCSGRPSWSPSMPTRSWPRGLPMVDFSSAQASIAEARRARDAAQAAAAQARERQKELASARARLTRALDPNDRAAAAEQRRLDALAAEADADLTRKRGEAARAEAAEGTALKDLAEFT